MSSEVRSTLGAVHSASPDHAYQSAPRQLPLDPYTFKYSVVIPVYNSEAIVGDTVDQIVAEFARQRLSYELILVNDGSHDRSWEIISAKAREHPHVVALNLLRNYGQHNANLAGLRESTGDYVITMDDDLQNPPDQMRLLIDEAMKGRDVVFGQFEAKQAAAYRRLGSQIIAMINRRVFGQPFDLAVTNFRILRRDVVDRISASRSAYPYITGQALLCSSNRSNVSVRHEPRKLGKSQYSPLRITRLVLTILFSYSLLPLRLAAIAGFTVSLLSFALGAIYLVHGLLFGARVPGWTTLVVLLSIFSGVTIALLSMLGEYVVRILNTVSAQETYHVVERVSR